MDFNEMFGIKNEPQGDAEPQFEAADGNPVKHTEQSADERRENAARRRREEMRAAVDAAVAEERRRFEVEPAAEVADVAEEPTANAPEETEDQSERESERIRELLMIDRQIAALREIDPALSSLTELIEGERGGEFLRNYEATRDIIRAYRMTYFDIYNSREREALRRESVYSTAGRSHLRATATRGAGSPMLTRGVIDAYREIDPDATIEEIRRFEAKYHRRKN